MKSLGGFFDIPTLTTKVEELELQSQSNDIWNDAAKAKAVMRERSQCAERLEQFKKLESLKGDAEAAFELARESGDDDFMGEAALSIQDLDAAVGALEFKC